MHRQTDNTLTQGGRNTTNSIISLLFGDKIMNNIHIHCNSLSFFLECMPGETVGKCNLGKVSLYKNSGGQVQQTKG